MSLTNHTSPYIAPVSRKKPPWESELAKSAEHPAQAAPPPWEREDWTPLPEPDDPPGERLRKMRELMWGPLTDEEYRRRLKSGSFQVRKIKVTPDIEKLESMTKLKAARKKVQALGAVVRDEAFDDWLSQHVLNAERPDEWTRSRMLYENYLKRAKDYGQSRPDKALSKQALATETMWGKMMGSLYPNKKRTRDGWFYPVRLKRGA